MNYNKFKKVTIDAWVKSEGNINTAWDIVVDVLFLDEWDENYEKFEGWFELIINDLYICK